MKKPFLLVLLLTIAFTHLTPLRQCIAQTTIQLTYTAEVNGIWVPLDSIRIENITQVGDTTMYAPDTVLVLDHGIGINNRFENPGNQMILHPAYPNPVTHTSTVRLWLPQHGLVTIRLYDIVGRELASFSRSLGAGEHIFTFTPGKETVYLLVAEAADQHTVQKLINQSPGNEICRISYTGYQPPASGMRKSKSTFPWVPGDDLRLIGYTSIGVDTIDDNPVQNTIYTFLFLPPVADFSVSDTLIFVNDTVLFTDLSTGNPTSWKWFFGDGDSSLMQNPSHIYTTTGVYSVTLIASKAGVTDTLTKSSQIYVQAPYPPGTVHCTPWNPTAVVDVTNPTTGRIWMDRNLGAFQVASNSADAMSYGDLYQWGRFSDGHQCRISNTTNTLSYSDVPGHGNFILTPNSPYDWRVPQNDNLWQGVNGTNNPCPTGYRLPTEAEWDAERLSWYANHSSGAFVSPLKLPLAGHRNYTDGWLQNDGQVGYYWSSAVLGTNGRSLYFDGTSANMANRSRSRGFSVRCIKD